jgi:hypothetical protein
MQTNTGGGAVLDSKTAAPDQQFPPIEGAVHAAVPDGAGGWYIGGHFTAVAGVYRQNLAHILSTGALDSNWNPSANDTVFALAKYGDSVVAGGSFTTVNGKTRNRLASFDTFGTVTSWNPNVDNIVRTLRISRAGTVYFGGNFTTVGGKTRNRLASVTASGILTAWNPNANSTVYALTIFESLNSAGTPFSTWVAVGGAFPKSAITTVTVWPSSRRMAH